MAYTFQQLEQFAAQAGFPASLQPTMAAIALAESSGNPYALNPTDNGGTQSSYGLWQISTGTHAAPSSGWADPLTNARLAYQKWQTQGLRAWGTYNTGAYLKYMPGGSAYTGASGPSGSSGSTSSGGGFSGVPSVTTTPLSWLDQLQTALQWLSNPARVLKLVAGVLLLAIGLLGLFWDNPTVQSGVQTAKSTALKAAAVAAA